jgi:hypothetical protein
VPGPSNKPRKRRITGDDATEPDEGGAAPSAKARDEGPAAPGARKPGRSRSGGRVTPKGGNAPVKKVRNLSSPEGSTRYTPPSHRPEDLPSPTWVPVLMFSLFGLGMVTILGNYVELLPGAVSNWYLLLGLGFILGGIITATQYR